MSVYLFDSQGIDRQLGEEATLKGVPDDQLLWIRLRLKESFSAGRFGLPAMAGEFNDLTEAIVLGADGFQAEVPGFAHTNLDRNDLIFIIGDNWVVSRSDLDQPVFDHFLSQDQGKGLRGNLTGIGLFVSLLFSSFERYHNVITDVADTVDRLDESILRSRRRRHMLENLANLRARVAVLRKTIVLSRPLVRSLARPDFLEPLQDRDAKHVTHLAIAYDRLEDQLSEVREEIIASFDLHTTKIAQDTNELIKVLTVVTVITGLIGAMAGVMGMNVEVPLQHAGSSAFFVILAIMAFVGSGVLVIAKMRRWL